MGRRVERLTPNEEALLAAAAGKEVKGLMLRKQSPTITRTHDEGYTMKINWPTAVVFCLITIVLGLLVYAGKLSPEVLLAPLAQLAPSPLVRSAAASKPKNS